MTFTEQNNIICQEQHGFRRHHSCESQLLGLLDDLTDNLEKGKQTDALIMDFSKAFDKVCHSLLVHKLEQYGIIGKVNHWISSFLADRKQAVVVDGVSSSLVPVESGVPQGSVLGPCLFLFYINDLPADLTSTARLFADDTLCHKTITSPADQQALQNDLDLLVAWEQKWLMQFHPEKCQTLRFTRSRNPSANQYQFHGHTLSITHEAKYLGVTITEDIKWEPHINNIVNKANKTLGFLRRNLRVKSQQIKQQAYLSLVRPSLEFASPVWDPFTAKDINKLESVQRRAARWVVNRHRQTSSVDTMLTHLHWPTLQARRRKARLTAFYKYHTGQLNICSNRRPTKSPPVKSTRNSHSEAYLRPSCRTQYRQFSFFPRTIAEWNDLPSAAVLSTATEVFKSQI